MDNKAKSKATVAATVLAKPNSKKNTEIEAVSPNCPLCHHQDTPLFFSYNHRNCHRDYHRCPSCDLTFVPAAFHLSNEDEKAIYDLHENSPDDSGYRKFLSRIASPLIKRLKPGSEGLDFGSGPGPTLAIMLREEGFPTEIFDIYYANNPRVLERNYDFITSTEVVEHLSQPDRIFNQLFSMLRKGGILGLMTKRPPDGIEAFRNWHYIKDPTHITFYSEKTFLFLASKYNCVLELVGPDTAILTSK